MEILKLDDLPNYSREFERKVYKLFTERTNNQNIGIYLGIAPTGHLEKHMHTKSSEIIFFPIGGSLEINGIVYEFGAWDGVRLDPGDIHGWPFKGKKPIHHLAIKFPDIDDRVAL